MNQAMPVARLNVLIGCNLQLNEFEAALPLSGTEWGEHEWGVQESFGSN
jgi:hypothetical protein